MLFIEQILMMQATVKSSQDLSITYKLLTDDPKARTSYIFIFRNGRR